MNDLEKRIVDAIGRVAVGPNRGKDIAEDDAQLIMEGILEGRVDPVRAGVFLIGLRMKGESFEELSGLLKAMQSATLSASSTVSELTQLVDPFDGYQRHLPTSPFLPAVLAAAGVNTVFVGVERVGPKYGLTAHQVLSAAGMNALLDVEQVNKQLSKVGWAYYDQSVFAPKVFQLFDLRDKIVKRTAITTTERVVRPLAGLHKTHLAIGYVHKAYRQTYSNLASSAGFSSVTLIKGVEGGVSPALNKPVRLHYDDFCNANSGVADDHSIELNTRVSAEVPAHRYTVDSGEVGTKPNTHAEQCLEQGLDALRGVKNLAYKGLLASAASILFAQQRAESFQLAVEKVEQCLDNGSAFQKFELLRV